MSRPIAVLRPEPGNIRTAAAIEARGGRVIRLPLFAARPLAWTPPDPRAFDALLLTSANALRHGGTALTRLRDLPVHAVGTATAEAARRAGFRVAAVGSEGVERLEEQARALGVTRALHLCGRERTEADRGIIAHHIAVYASEALAVLPHALAPLAGAVALVQSARAAKRLAGLVDAVGLPRDAIRLAALSPAVATAAGEGWGALEVAATPESEALIATALRLAD